jgi:hypothetical protein
VLAMKLLMKRTLMPAEKESSPSTVKSQSEKQSYGTSWVSYVKLKKELPSRTKQALS